MVGVAPAEPTPPPAAVRLRRRGTGGVGVRIRAALFAVAALALLLPLLVVLHPPAVPHRPSPRALAAARARRVVPPVELPPVEPVKLIDLSPDDARAFNAAVPFSPDPNPAARPFRFAGPPEDAERARDCLAAAVIYEAGDDATGERAVAQVILNRLRHPAFPKTVCGVVFQGSERPTGCQFTFTCDGALTRWTPSEAGWRRARDVAALALGGAVFRPVGYATHYHTEWVVPYWSSSLDKITAVGAHLFFRWSGWWGTPPAFNRHPLAGEPAEARLAALSDAHRTGAALADATGAMADAALAEAGAAAGPALEMVGRQGDSFLVTLPRDLGAERWPALAGRACGDRPYCKVLGWTDARRTAEALPLDAQQVATLSFSYLRDRAGGFEKALWNCVEVRRPDPAQCMKAQVYQPAAPVDQPAAAPAATRGPDDLGGVRRRGVGPAAAPTPAPASMPVPTPAPRRGRVTPPGTSPATTP